MLAFGESLFVVHGMVGPAFVILNILTDRINNFIKNYGGGNGISQV